MKYRIVLILLMFTFPWQGTLAQYFPDWNDSSLKVVTAFDARVSIPAWLGVEADRERFLQNAQAAFEVALRRDGVVVDESAQNYLICELSVAKSSGIVFFSRGVEYWQWSSDGLHTLTWAAGGVVTVGLSNFNARDAIRGCVDQFTNQWLKHNPK